MTRLRTLVLILVLAAFAAAVVYFWKASIPRPLDLDPGEPEPRAKPVEIARSARLARGLPLSPVTASRTDPMQRLDPEVFRSDLERRFRLMFGDLKPRSFFFRPTLGLRFCKAVRADYGPDLDNPTIMRNLMIQICPHLLSERS